MIECRFPDESATFDAKVILCDRERIFLAAFATVTRSIDDRRTIKCGFDAFAKDTLEAASSPTGRPLSPVTID